MFCALLMGILIGNCFNIAKCGDGKIKIRDDENYLLVALVLSAPNNFDRRTTIRETWASLRPKHIDSTEYSDNVIFIPKTSKTSAFLERDTVDSQKTKLKKYLEWRSRYDKAPNIKQENLKIKVFFAIGTLNSDKLLVEKIHAESQIYNDLIILDEMIDSYQNLTLKLVSSLKTLFHSVPNFKYVLKTDDDSYVKLDLLSYDLLQYDQKLNVSSEHEGLGLYWGYFYGKANIKKSGQWQEENYNRCDRYTPYAAGGGYVISKSVVNFISSYAEELSLFNSEDVSMGNWLSPFRRIYWRHDVRFDTTYMPRKCQKYHLILHKRTAADMREIHAGNICYSEVTYNDSLKPKEHWYDWSVAPSKCCDRKTSQ